MSKITGHVKWFNESKGFGFITPMPMALKTFSFIFPLSLAMVSRPWRKVSRLSSPSRTANVAQPQPTSLLFND